LKAFISIIIPTFNRARELNRAIESVINQTYKNWELIIIDNNSSDNTDEVVSKFNDSRILLFKINNNGIIAKSRNLGIKKSSGSFIAFLDSDDWWLPKKIEISLKYLEKGADIVYHDLFISKKGALKNTRKAKTRSLFSPIFNDLLVNGNALNTSSVVLQKKLCEDVDLFSEEKELIAIEDFDAWLKLSTITEKFERIPKALGYYSVGINNTSNPKQTIKTIDIFLQRNKKIINTLTLENKISWVYYAKGRQNLILENFDIALNQFKKIITMDTFIIIKCKSFFFITVIYFQKLKGMKPK
jgi:glycosyltransferase involved in cell wall biosynthesis